MKMEDGLYCDGGKRHVYIDWDGSVYTCRNPYARIGNILKEQLSLREEEYSLCHLGKCKFECIGVWTIRRIVENGIVTKEIPRWRGNGEFKNPLFIWFTPTLLCNYSCEYCVAHGSTSTFIVPVDQFISAFDRFFDVNGIDGGVCQFNGGEVMIYPGIGILMKHFVERGFLIEIVTNLSGNVYKDIVSYVSPSSMNSIYATIHPSEKKFQWESFEGKVLLLRSLGYKVAINFVGHPDQIMLAEKYHKWGRENGVRIQVIPLQGGSAGKTFETEEDYPEPLRRMFHLE